MTAAEIEAARTPAGGWTKAQLAEWGVPWPPPKGWKRALIGNLQPLAARTTQPLRLQRTAEPAAPGAAHRVDRGLLHAFFSVLFWRSYAETLNRLEAEGVWW